MSINDPDDGTDSQTKLGRVADTAEGCAVIHVVLNMLEIRANGDFTKLTSLPNLHINIWAMPRCLMLVV